MGLTILAVARSPSARRAWIEILWCRTGPSRWTVALRTEGVDRNSSWLVYGGSRRKVALRTEGVDRNLDIIDAKIWVTVALRTEGVDRNKKISREEARCSGSPSARRAWIEIWRRWYSAHTDHPVALRTEGVDRNPAGRKLVNLEQVALRTEGVDRN